MNTQDYTQKASSINSPEVKYIYMILGHEVDANLTKSNMALVGIAESPDHMNNLIGKDYLSVLESKNLNPVSSPIICKGGSITCPNYCVEGYEWSVVKVELNNLLNFAL